MVPFFGYSTPKACLGVRRTSLTTKQNQDEIACDHKEIPYSDDNLPFNARVNRNLRSSFTRNQSPKNESYEETPTCVLRHRNLSVQSSLSGWQNINPLSYLLSLLRQNGLQRADNLSRYCSLCQTIWTRGLPTRDSSSITGLVLDKSFP